MKKAGYLFWAVLGLALFVSVMQAAESQVGIGGGTSGGGGGSAFNGGTITDDLIISKDDATFQLNPGTVTKKSYLIGRSARNSGDDYALQNGFAFNCDWDAATGLWTHRSGGITECLTFGIAFTGDLTLKYSPAASQGTTRSDAGWTRAAEFWDAAIHHFVFDGLVNMAGNLNMGTGSRIQGNSTVCSGGGVTFGSAGQMVPGCLPLASLGTPTNGSIFYCTDCAYNSNPCTGSSTGAIAKRINGAWRCD